MDFARERELVHLRYELRQLMADGRRQDAPPLLARLRQIAEADAFESASLRPEIERWASSFGLAATY
jgi:hypothetical protein